MFFSLWLINQPRPHTKPSRNKGFNSRIIRNQWVFISPDHKAGYFLGVNMGPQCNGGGGGCWLTSHDLSRWSEDVVLWCEILGTLGDMARVMLQIGTHQPIEEEVIQDGPPARSLKTWEFFFKKLWPLVWRRK